MRYFIFCLLWLNFPTLSAAPIEERGWLAFGDMRGNLEPCGCNPEADLGGLKRLGTLLKRERALRPDLVLISLGNNFAANFSDEKLKTKYLYEGLFDLKADVILANVTEIQALNLKKQASKYEKNFVISNLKAASPLGQVKLIGDSVFLGYVYADEIKDKVEKVSPVLIAKWRKLIPISKNKIDKVLLFNGSDQDLKMIEKAKIFDFIISSNKQSLKTVIGPEEKENPELLNRRGVRMVPLGGQGVLRGGVLARERAQSLKELLDKTQPQTIEPPMFISSPVTWLDTSFEVGSPFEDLFKRYNKENNAAFDQSIKTRLASLKDTKFVGSEACKTCHVKAYETWRKSAHAHAFATLQNQQKDKDATCVQCHVLAFDKSGGFVSYNDTPKFANVNCENCHGPRKEHAANPTMKPTLEINPKEVCVQCHHGTHTPKFVFKDFWSKIIH